MKYAWWLIAGLVIFLLCTQQALAYEVAGFDPTAQYVVHSIPLVVDDAVKVEFNPADSSVTQKSTSVSHSKKSVEKAPATSSEGDQGVLAQSVVQSGSNAKVDLTSLTYGAQQHDSFFSRIGGEVSSFVSSVASDVSSTVRNGFGVVSGFLKNSVDVVSTALQNGAYTFVRSVSSIINTVAGDLTYGVNQYLHFLHDHALFFALIAVAGPGIALFVSTPIGRAIAVGVAKFAFAGLVSAVDLVLHASCFVAGVITSLRTGVTVSKGYVQAKEFIKKKTGHDIGDFSSDVRVVVTRVIVVLMLMALPELIAGGAAAVTTISAETAPELALRGSYALNKTSIDCTTMIGQCDTKTGLALTAGSNFLFGVAPSANIQVLDEEESSVAKVLGSADEAATVIKRSELEQKAGKEFVKEVFGNAKGVEFEEMAKKWPNTLEKINEGAEAGHVIAKHVGKTDEFLKDRVLIEGNKTASTFYDEKSMLNSVESALADSTNRVKINDWLANPGSRNTTDIVYNGQVNVGRVFESSTGELSDAKNARVVLKKENGSYYILSAYVER